MSSKPFSRKVLCATKHVPTRAKEIAFREKHLAMLLHPSNVKMVRHRAFLRLLKVGGELYPPEGYIPELPDLRIWAFSKGSMSHQDAEKGKRFEIRASSVDGHRGERFYGNLRDPMRPFLKLMRGANTLSRPELARSFTFLFELLGPNSNPKWTTKWWYDPIANGSIRPILDGEQTEFPPCKHWEAWNAEDL